MEFATEKNQTNEEIELKQEIAVKKQQKKNFTWKRLFPFAFYHLCIFVCLLCAFILNNMPKCC